MQDLTEAEIAAIKDDAAKRFSVGRVHEIILDEPADVRAIFACHDRASYAAFADEEARDRGTAVANLLTSRRLYPDAMTLGKLMNEWPALPGKMANDMEAAAGGVAEDAVRIRPIEPHHVAAAQAKAKDALALEQQLAVSPGDYAVVARQLAAAQTQTQAMLPDGLEPHRVAELVSQAKGQRLWSVEIAEHGLSLVMISPVAQLWRAAVSRDLDARVAKTGIIASTQDAVLASVRWTKEPLLADGAGLLEVKPALYWWLWNCWRKMGGEGVRLRSRTF